MNDNNMNLIDNFQMSHDEQFYIASKVNREKFDALMLAKKHICDEIIKLTESDYKENRKKIYGLIEANDICTKIIWGVIND